MTTPLAIPGFGALDWSLFVIGLFVAGVLIASFVWGLRRKRREAPPIPPSSSPAAPDPVSWTTPDEAARTRPTAHRSPAHGRPRASDES